jgi:hypothetical protein
MNNLFEEVLKPDTPCAGGDLWLGGRCIIKTTEGD